MDELKLLIGMVTGLPAMAVWVLAGYLAYKLALVGSTFGIARLVVVRMFDWLSTAKAREVEYKEIRPMLDGLCVRGETDRLIAQLHRLKGKGVSIKTDYIHGASVDWLREAIDAKIESERGPK